MNQSDIREVLAYLAKELDEQTFGPWSERNKTELPIKSKDFGTVELEQSIETINKPFQRVIHFSLLDNGEKYALQPAPARCKLNASTEDISVEVRGTIYLPVRKRSAKFAVVDGLHDGFRINDVQLPAVRDKK